MTTYLRVALRDEDADATEDGPIPFVLATSGRKADGLDLAMGNADLERYTHNPVLGYGHDYWSREGMPIGRVDNVRTDKSRLLGDLVFDRDDPFAVKVESKIRNRYINAVSIGFDAHDIDDNGVPKRWELFETSVVPLPMDPDAVADDGRALAIARAFGGLPDLGALGRAGKVLSKKNQTLVENAVGALEDAAGALTALLDAAQKEADDGDEDEGRATADMETRRRRLDLAMASN